MISLKNTSCRFAWARYLHWSAWTITLLLLQGNQGQNGLLDTKTRAPSEDRVIPLQRFLGKPHGIICTSRWPVTMAILNTTSHSLPPVSAGMIYMCMYLYVFDCICMYLHVCACMHTWRRFKVSPKIRSSWRLQGVNFQSKRRLKLE
jgi:hypothetical protein